MDPSLYLPFSPPNGLPQESKLATYMNHTTSTPINSLNQALGKISLESSPTVNKKNLIGEFVPANYYNHRSILPESPETPPPPTLTSVSTTTQVHQENVGGTTYFYSTSDSINTPGALNPSTAIGGTESCLGPVGPGVSGPSAYATQMYSGTPTHMGVITSKPGLASSFYFPETIRSEICQRNEDVFLQVDLRQYPDLPENVEMYSELTPLEAPAPHCIASSYRATHRQSGEQFALRRLHAHVPAASLRLEFWKQIDHPNIVRLHEYFTTKAFGDHSTVLVYDYHPACATLLSKYLSGSGAPATEVGAGFLDPFSADPDAPRPYTHQKNAMLRAVACGALLPEAVLWSLLVQLTAALRTVHAAGLACRSLEPTKVVMSGCRVRVAWCGAPDALHSAPSDVPQAQQDDLTALGRLALALACRSLHCDNLQACVDLVARTYSADLKNFIMYLLSSNVRRSVTDLMPMIGARFYTQVDALERRADALEEQLAREIDNGRLLRILIKLGVVNDRPELNMDAAWSETGDRYMLKLFRDYLFHSVGTDGRPWLDQAHFTYCLNQLDGGTAAKVVLMSRDQRSVLVVSYAELKRCLEQAFEEVMQASSTTP